MNYQNFLNIQVNQKNLAAVRNYSHPIYPTLFRTLSIKSKYTTKTKDCINISIHIQSYLCDTNTYLFCLISLSLSQESIHIDKERNC